MRKTEGKQSPENVLQNVITYFCFKVPTLSHTKLVKLIYLADVYHMERHGSRLTDVPFKHWYYGPWSEQIDSEVEHLCGKGIIKQELYLTRSGRVAEIPKPDISRITVNLPNSAFEVLTDVVEEWALATADEITAHVKTTLPFVGTSFGEEIDFARFDAVKEFAKEKNISLEEAATLLVENDKNLLRSLARAREKAKA